MHYTRLIDALISSNEEYEQLMFCSNGIEYLVDKNGDIRQIIQLPNTFLSRQTYKMLVDISDINSETHIRLNKIRKHKCEKLISKYGRIKTFSSRYLPYVESQMTEILLERVSKRHLKINHGSYCLLLQSTKPIENLSKLNDLIAELQGIKIIITNIDGLAASGDVAFVVIADKFMNNLSFEGVTNIDIGVNQKSKYYRTEDYDDISKIIGLNGLV